MYLNLRYSVKDGTRDLLILNIDRRGGEVEDFGGREEAGGGRPDIVFIK
mgnify:CR=1